MDEKLFYAVEGNDLTTLNHLVASGANVDQVYVGACAINKSQWSLLHMCCSGGKYDCAKILLEAGSCPDIPDKHGIPPLMYSIHAEWRHLTELFLDSGAKANIQEKTGRTPLHVAAEAQDPKLIELLLTKAKDPIDVNLCCQEGNTPCAVTVTTDGHVTHLRQLIDAGCDVNLTDLRNRRTPLQRAILESNDDMSDYVQILLNHNADLHNIDRFNHSVLMTLLLRKSKQDHNALMTVALMLLHHYEGIVNLKGTASRQIHYDGGPLHMAVEYGYRDFVKLFLDHGADSNITNSSFLTPLHLAVAREDFLMTSLLLGYRCNTSVKGTMLSDNTFLNGTPFQFALEKGNLQLAILLLSGGHKLSCEEYIWKESDVQPDALISNQAFLQWLMQEMECDMSLMQLSRNVIRLSMAGYLGQLKKRGFKPGVLYLPPRLEEYIVLPDFL